MTFGDKHLAWSKGDIDTFMAKRAELWAEMRTFIERAVGHRPPRESQQLLNQFDILTKAATAEYDLEQQLESSKQLVQEARNEVRSARAEGASLQKFVEERHSLVEELKALRAKLDPAHIAGLIRDAREDAARVHASMIEKQAAEIATLKRERDELAVSKKRLREALERMKATR